MMEDGDTLASRFHVLEKLFKIAGAPVAADGESRSYTVYRVLVVVSGYLTLLTTFIGIVQNLGDMAYVMEAARPGFVMINLLWMHFLIRYYFLIPAGDRKYCSSNVIYDGRLKSSCTHLITPSRSFVEVR
jgi:hypothetical protein